MVSPIGAAALVLAALAMAAPAARAAPPSAPSAGKPGPGGPTGSKPAPAPSPSKSSSPSGSTDPVAPPVSQDAAARARMHECAHQWSSIKKAGNAGTTTWKEFSATCLVVSK